MYTEVSLKQCSPKGNDCHVQRFGFTGAFQTCFLFFLGFFFAYVKCLNISVITFSLLTEKQMSYRTNVRVSCVWDKDKSP